MNREILFRGKRVDNGEWAYGVYVPEKSVILGYFEVNSLDTDCDLINCKAVVRRVNSKTVGQYTGLTDRNGVKIFENDIVKHIWDSNGNMNYYETFIVVYERGAFYISPIRKSKYVWKVYIPDKNIEIIGNIHDNPELLKGEEIV